MAQLKDLLVTGASNLLGPAIIDDIQITKVYAPTTSNGTIYGLGTANYVLASNGSSVYWKSSSENTIDNISISTINGTTAGPVLKVEVNDQSSEVTIPIATTTTSGVITTGAQTIKGIKTFTQIPIAPTPANSSNDTSVATTAFVNTIVNGYLPLSGGTMIGSLILNVDPTNELQAATKRYVDNAFTANDAMVFKGTIGSSEDQAMYEDLPTEHEVGWTYRVVTEGFYDQLRCEVGDLIVCIKSSNEETSGNDGSLIIGDFETFGDPTGHWIVVQSNIDGTVFGPSESASGIAMFTGTTGKAIRDSGKTITTTAPTATSTDATIPTSKAVWTTVENSRIEVVRLI